MTDWRSSTTPAPIVTSVPTLSSRIRGYLADYWLVLGDTRRKLRSIGATMLALAALDLLGVGLIAPFAQLLATGAIPHSLSALGRHPRLVFLLFGLGLIAIFLIKAFVGYRLNHTIVAFSAGYRADLIRRLMAAYQGQSWQYHLERNSNELVNRVLWYTERYSSGTLDASLQFATNALVCLALFILLSTKDVLSVAILGAFLGTVFLITHRRVRDQLRAATKETAKHSGQIVRGVKQALEGFREVRILGVEKHFRDEISAAAQNAARSSARASALGMVPRYTFEVAVVAVLVVLGSVTALQEGSPASAVPVLGMFAAAAVRLLPASTALLSSLNQLRASRFVLGELAAELRAVAQLPVPGEVLPRTAQPEPFVRLELRNVCFTYPGAETAVLRDVNLSIRAGETVGLMGRSGAGKSTLADIVLGFFVPQSGSVRVNGKDIHEDLRAWLTRATYIPQSVFLIDDTLRRNIEFGIAEGARNSERLQWAVEQAQLAELVASLPNGLETFVGEDGARLSGGQRQRVALARALYHERDFIVLDEATSALDTETEDAVVKAVMGLAGAKTLFVIAHRESTLSGCSVRLTLREGRLVPMEQDDRSSQGNPQDPAHRAS